MEKNVQGKIRLEGCHEDCKEIFFIVFEPVNFYFIFLIVLVWIFYHVLTVLSSVLTLGFLVISRSFQTSCNFIDIITRFLTNRH